MMCRALDGWVRLRLNGILGGHLDEAVIFLPGRTLSECFLTHFVGHADDSLTPAAAAILHCAQSSERVAIPDTPLLQSQPRALVSRQLNVRSAPVTTRLILLRQLTLLVCTGQFRFRSHVWLIVGQDESNLADIQLRQKVGQASKLHKSKITNAHYGNSGWHSGESF